MGGCSSQLAWLFHVLSSCKLLKRHICKIVKAICKSDIWREKKKRFSVQEGDHIPKQHFKNQIKGNITVSRNWNTCTRKKRKVRYSIIAGKMLLNGFWSVKTAFAATCPFSIQACHIFGIVISHIPCLLLAKPPQSNEKYKGCQAN